MCFSIIAMQTFLGFMLDEIYVKSSFANLFLDELIFKNLEKDHNRMSVFRKILRIDVLCSPSFAMDVKLSP